MAFQKFIRIRRFQNADQVYLRLEGDVLGVGAVDGRRFPFPQIDTRPKNNRKQRLNENQIFLKLKSKVSFSGERSAAYGHTI